MKDEPPKPFEVQKMKATTHCFVEEEVLEKKGICLFKGEFRALDNKKVQMVTLPANFQAMGKDDKNLQIFKNLVKTYYLHILLFYKRFDMTYKTNLGPKHPLSYDN